jgi:integrase
MRNRSPAAALSDSFAPYLQDIGKGRDGDGGHYRRNVERELNRFVEWANGDHDDSDTWTGIVPDDTDRNPRFEDLDERVFRSYARHLTGERGLKQNTAKTYYRYISAWVGWCVTEGYLDAHYAKRSTATNPLPDDDGRRPGDQQAWSPEDRHQLTEYTNQRVNEALEDYSNADRDSPEKQSRKYYAIKAARDRALVYIIAYTAVRIGEILSDPEDPRRRGLRWEEVNLEDGSIEVYRKKQQWDTASLPDPVIGPIERYEQLIDPPSGRWPVFPTFDQRSLADLVTSKLAEDGLKQDEIKDLRDEYPRDLLLAIDKDICPDSMTAKGARDILQRLTDAADIDVSASKHTYLSPHGGRRGMGEVLVRAFGYTVAARYLDNSEEMVRERYSHIEAGKLGDMATEGIKEVDSVHIPQE